MTERKVHLMQYVMGMPDFIGDRHNVIGTQYAVRICDGKPVGELTEEQKRVTCPRCRVALKKRRRKHGG